jgi:hypothetical protein
MQKISQEQGNWEQRIETFFGVVPASPSLFTPQTIKDEQTFIANMKYESQQLYSIKDIQGKADAQTQITQEIIDYLRPLSGTDRKRVRYKLMINGVSTTGTGDRDIQGLPSRKASTRPQRPPINR